MKFKFSVLNLVYILLVSLDSWAATQGNVFNSSGEPTRLELQDGSLLARKLNTEADESSAQAYSAHQDKNMSISNLVDRHEHAASDHAYAAQVHTRLAEEYKNQVNQDLNSKKMMEYHLAQVKEHTVKWTIHSNLGTILDTAGTDAVSKAAADLSSQAISKSDQMAKSEKMGPTPTNTTTHSEALAMHQSAQRLHYEASMRAQLVGKTTLVKLHSKMAAFHARWAAQHFALASPEKVRS